MIYALEINKLMEFCCRDAISCLPTKAIFPDMHSEDYIYNFSGFKYQNKDGGSRASNQDKGLAKDIIG